MNLWDTHCHLFREYYEDVPKMIQDAMNAGVTHFVVSGCDTKSNQEVLDLLSRISNIYGVIGIHPEEARRYEVSDLSVVEKHLLNPKIIGIGEIGLDYHYSKEDKEQQKELFEKQLAIAQKYHLPVVIHSREATEDTIEILKKYHVNGVIHSFSGSLETAKIYIKMGFYLGINGVVTFKNSKLKFILPDIFPYIVLETDSPYLTPHPYRGRQNQPKYIRYIAEFIAEELQISIQQVEEITNQNIRRIFDKLGNL